MSRPPIWRGIVIAVGATVASAILLGAWTSKESKVAHDADVRALAHDVQKQDSIRAEMMLDILCARNVDPHNRRCHQ